MGLIRQVRTPDEGEERACGIDKAEWCRTDRQTDGQFVTWMSCGAEMNTGKFTKRPPPPQSGRGWLPNLLFQNKALTQFYVLSSLSPVCFCYAGTFFYTNLSNFRTSFSLLITIKRALEIKIKSQNYFKMKEVSISKGNRIKNPNSSADPTKGRLAASPP